MSFNLEQVSLRLERIKAILPREVDPKLSQFHCTIPFKVISIRDALLHRLVNLGEEALSLHRSKSLIPFLLTVRACLETAALMFILNRNIEETLKDSSLELLTEQLQRMALGSRNSSTNLSSVNILGAIDHLEKKHPGIRQNYDNLSEYVHPNFEGVLCSYSDVKDKTKFTFKLQSERIKIGEPPLEVALIVGLHAYDCARTNYDKMVGKFYA